MSKTRHWSGSGMNCRGECRTRPPLTESRGDVKVVVVFCDTWDSASFQEEHREELGAHARNGVRFLFMLVGVPDRVLVPVPVEFD